VTEVAEPAVGPRERRVRWRYVVVALLCAGAVAWMLVLMQRNVVFFKTVSQAVHDQAHDGTQALRIGGGVLPGTIKQRSDGVDFELTEGGATVTVHHTGNEPPLFKDCAPVVAEGHWASKDAPTFVSTRLLIKHGNDYQAPKNSRVQCPKDPFGR
jgi:cytochrome c-type biogenesis protein CcmE